MNVPGDQEDGAALRVAQAFDIAGAKTRLADQGGYEIVHESPGLEIGVYVLVAPEPDHQQPHADDEVYVVLEGQGTLEVDGRRVELHVGEATFVPAGARHQFVGYEQLSVLVIFDKGRH
jgi:mannose-6-phosphate isomerase-like protein (cupin superfamily)